MAESKPQRAMAVPTDWERMSDAEKQAWLADRLRPVTNRTVYSWDGQWNERDGDDDWDDT